MTLKNRRSVISITVAALIAIPTAVLYTGYAIQNQPEPARQTEATLAPKVTVMPVSASSHRARIQLFGEVLPADEISLNSEIAGRVIWRNPNFVDGGRLNEGDTLIRIDDTEYQAQLANAQQSLAEARLALEQEKLQKQQALQDWQRAGIAEKPTALALREPQLQVARSRYTAARNAVKLAQQNLEKTVITAPFDAVIAGRQIAEGSYLERGSTVTTLRRSDQARISLALTAAQWNQLPQDLSETQATLTSRDLPGIQWQGKADYLSLNIEHQTRLRTLVINVDQPLDQATPLLFGSFVQAELSGADVPDLFALPDTALTSDGYIWYVADNRLNRVRRTPLFSHGSTLYVARGDLPAQIDLVRKPVTGYLNGITVLPVSDKLEVADES